MTDLIVARFDTQFAACSAVDKLLSRRIRREQIVLSFDESVGNSAASSSAPTTVVSRVSHRGPKLGPKAVGPERRSSSFRSPQILPNPARFGHTMISLELRGELSAAQASSLLEKAGGHSITHESQAQLAENPSMWPENASAPGLDVDRAIDAARGGAAR
jgi:hypothetical protein